MTVRRRIAGIAQTVKEYDMQLSAQLPLSAWEPEPGYEAISELIDSGVAVRDDGAIGGKVDPDGSNGTPGTPDRDADHVPRISPLVRRVPWLTVTCDIPYTGILVRALRALLAWRNW
ncbi:hypothetical protein [Demequina lutea]|nr:hypothetical protein [Demequina lutea]